jgi:4-diphosphocytidyl-2-C-methyl-D-erythritol kinase
VPSGTYRSFAKINLHLQVIGRRSDGFHELRSLFQSIDLHDLVRVELGPPGVRLTVEEGPAPGGPENLAHRAATRFLDRWGPPGAGADIGLHKRLPMGGGLGAGSSNAATVLRALRQICGRPESVEGLSPLARELGADVPFFLDEGTALGVGRGDEVLPLPELAGEDLLVVCPPVAVSTVEAFARLEPAPAPAFASSVLRLAGAPPGIRPSRVEAWNDFQGPVLAWYPELAQVYNSLLDAGARVVRLSGTGSALYGFFEEPPPEEAVRGKMPANCFLLRTRTLSRQEVESRRVVVA